MEIKPATSVFYDASCPLCRREIDFYRKRADADAIHWRDVSGVESAALPAGKTADEMMARFHVETADGRLLDGGDAFLSLWLNFEGFRSASKVLRNQPLRTLVNLAYDAFLIIRPALQRLSRVVFRSREPDCAGECTIRDPR